MPDVDCVLLLRPTASATGVRPAARTRPAPRCRARATSQSSTSSASTVASSASRIGCGRSLDTRRGPVVEQVDADFPFLPAGCTVDLDRQSREIVLDNLKAAVRRSRWPTLVVRSARASRTAPPCSSSWIAATIASRTSTEVSAAGRGYAATRAIRTLPPTTLSLEQRSLRALGRLTHIDDPERIAFYRELLRREAPPRERGFDERQRPTADDARVGPRVRGNRGTTSIADFFAALWREEAVRAELVELLDVLDARSRTRSTPSLLPPEIPLTLHARYSRQEVIAALGFGDGVKPKVTQGGILWVPQAAERRLLRRPAQGRARLLADDDVPRLRDQSRAFPLGVAIAADTAAADRSALHQPRTGRHAGAAVRS